MIVDLERVEQTLAFPADVCIIGAGAAGIVLADQLVRRGRRVLLLESGGPTLESASQDLNQCICSGQPHRADSIGRFRVLGGTTTVWGGQILEFTEEDFEKRSWIAGSGWPFPKNVLESSYRRALDAEGLSGAMRTDACVWSRFKTDEPRLGEDLVPYFTRWCPEPDFARHHRVLFGSTNVCMVLHATANEFVLNENSDTVLGIRCATTTGKKHIFAATQYVLCLGTVESVRFLLQPFFGGHTSPWNRSGLIGKYFQSHIDYDAAQVQTTDAPRLRQLFANAYLDGYKYHPKFRLAFSVQQQEQLLNIAGSITCTSPGEKELAYVKSLARNALRGNVSGMSGGRLLRSMRQLPALLRLAQGYVIERRAYWPRDSVFRMRVHSEQEPTSASSIRLARERDAVGMLRAHIDWHVTPLEWRTIRRFTEMVQRNFLALGLGCLTITPELLRDDGYSSVTFDNSHHDMGGTRMAANHREGVVDPDLRLYGIRNASVCSASVFPTSGFSNPTHTLLALAIRLAEHLDTSVLNRIPSRIAASTEPRRNA